VKASFSGADSDQRKKLEVKSLGEGLGSGTDSDQMESLKSNNLGEDLNLKIDGRRS
jgi:hypothetical protein